MKASVLIVLGAWLLTACGAAPAPAPQPPPDVAAALPGPTGVAGRVLDRAGTPAAGAMVYAYRSARSGLRGPADFGAAVDAAGGYFLDLVEGEYHLVARQRHGGDDAGPPRLGDAWAVYPHNPLTVRPGYTSRADFVLQGVTQPRQLRSGSLSGGDTGFSGRLVDGAGRPVSGALVLAYRSTDLQRRPDYTSLPADEQGHFVLYLPHGGTWCLAARTEVRGQIRHGEPYGTLGDGPAACRSLPARQLLDVGDIVLRPYRR